MRLFEGRYKLLRHKITGEHAVIDTYYSRYERIAKGFLNKMQLRGRFFIKHITLTQKHENYHPQILNRFFMALKRRFGDVYYLWTVEVQEERLERTGEHVLHWHIIIGFPWDYRFGRDDILKIQSYWPYGNVDIKPVRHPSLSYLMKYITKAFDVGFEGVRRIGSSRVEAWFRQSFKAVIAALTFFSSVGESPESYYWYRGGAYVYVNPEYNRGRYYVYKPVKFWEVIGAYDGQPF